MWPAVARSQGHSRQSPGVLRRGSGFALVVSEEGEGRAGSGVRPDRHLSEFGIPARGGGSVEQGVQVLGRPGQGLAVHGEGGGRVLRFGRCGRGGDDWGNPAKPGSPATKRQREHRPKPASRQGRSPQSSEGPSASKPGGRRRGSEAPARGRTDKSLPIPPRTGRVPYSCGRSPPRSGVRGDYPRRSGTGTQPCRPGYPVRQRSGERSVLPRLASQVPPADPRAEFPVPPRRRPDVQPALPARRTAADPQAVLR